MVLEGIKDLEEKLDELFDSVNGNINLEYQVMKMQEKIEVIKEHVNDIEEVK